MKNETVTASYTYPGCDWRVIGQIELTNIIKPCRLTEEYQAHHILEKFDHRRLTGQEVSGSFHSLFQLTQDKNPCGQVYASSNCSTGIFRPGHIAKSIF